MIIPKSLFLKNLGIYLLSVLYLMTLIYLTEIAIDKALGTLMDDET
jgi:hypothetical protein